eukprot:5212403-Pyramimonas_sp.AAC.1
MKGQVARFPLLGEGLGRWRPASTTPRRTPSSTSAAARWSEHFRGAAEFENSMGLLHGAIADLL